jgi:hypothetical protein
LGVGSSTNFQFRERQKQKRQRWVELWVGREKVRTSEG